MGACAESPRGLVAREDWEPAMRESRNWFWSLALLSEQKLMDFPGLMETAVNHPQLRHDKHDKYTVRFCQFTTIDSTKCSGTPTSAKIRTCASRRSASFYFPTLEQDKRSR